MNDYFNEKCKLVIIDDDPTGMQTVHGCLALTKWDFNTLQNAFNDQFHFFFILANTRSLTAEEAASTIREIVKNVSSVSSGQKIKTIFLSRSDSTLRGHFPVELNTITETLNTEFDASFFIPAFFEGGRITENDIHYILTDGKKIPCHETEFAKDSIFPYADANLPNYIEFKTKGKVKAEDVVSFSRETLRKNNNVEILKTLMALENNRYAIVNAVNYDELNTFSNSLSEAMKRGKKFIFQTSASAVKSIVKCGNK